MSWDKLSMSSGGSGLPGPRDWSPAIEEGKKELQILHDKIRPDVLLSLKEVQQNGWPGIIELVENGLAFILHLRTGFHMIYIDCGGRIKIDPTVRAAFGGSP